MLKKCLSILLLGMVAPVFAAVQVHEFTLDNGLKVLVQEDHRAPVVVSQIWYKVGSSYEPRGLTGISHALEHMMFKGTETLEPGEFPRLITANGGEQNAFTSRDYTAYYQKLGNDKLALSFRLEADRMRNLVLTDEEFAKEIQVIAEERRLRTEDSPQSLTYEQFNATAYVTSPYRNPVIGWMQDIASMEVSDLRYWYRKWYAPNNAVVVVVGDVDPEQVRQLAETYFGPLKPSEPPTLKPAYEVVQHGMRRVIVKAPAELPQVVLGYKVPVLKTAERKWEPYALEVLFGILSAGNSGRLSRHLIRGSRIAVSAEASYRMESRLDELFMIAANPAPGRGIDAVEQALHDEVERLRENLVSPEELARVVAQVVAAEVYQLDSMFYQGMRMGVLETVGLGWDALEDYVAQIKAVTPEQVREVAQRYLVNDRLTVAILEPLPLPEVSSSAQDGLRTDPVIHGNQIP